MGRITNKIVAVGLIAALQALTLEAATNSDPAAPRIRRTYKYIPDSATHHKSLDFLRSTYGAQHLDQNHPEIQSLLQNNVLLSASLENASSQGAVYGLPSSVDMTSGYPDPFDQGTLGSCTANALVGIVLYDLVKQNAITVSQAGTVGNAQNPGGMLSRLYLYWQERNMEGNVNTDSGASLTDGISALHTKGVCHEYLWPYDAIGSTNSTTFTNTPSAAPWTAMP